MPKHLPQIPMSEILNYSAYSYPMIAFDIVKRFLGDEVEHSTLKSIAEDAYNYEIPLEHVYVCVSM